jgi:DNA processing protein
LTAPGACPDCRRRAWLLAWLAGHIDHHRSDRQSLAALLGLADRELIEAVGGRSRDELLRRYERWVDAPWAGPRPLPPAAQAAVCRHDDRFPEALAGLAGAPAILHLTGDGRRALRLMAAPCVAVVGARASSEYGREVARSLGHALAKSGVCVVSGMALGIDSAAHSGALEAGGPTLAVLPCGVDVPYPAGKRGLHRRLCAHASLVSEMPSGFRPRRWCFVARNRIIAALSRVTVVVEARERSGSLITAGYACDLDRDVGAVPGRVTTPTAAGTNGLIRDGAHLVRDAQDVLDLLYGVGVRHATATAPELERRLRMVLDRVRAGTDTPAALAAAGMEPGEAAAALTELELLGCVRRGLGGRYVPLIG